jgi:hypothetical protein
VLVAGLPTVLSCNLLAHVDDGTMLGPSGRHNE